MMDNPLLQLASLPDFATIHPEHIAPAIRQLLDETNAELQRLEAELEPTWSGLIEPLERIENRLSLAWGAVGHLMGVKNSEALRQAHQEVQGEVIQFWMQLGQSQAIYQGLKALKTSGDWEQLDAAQQRIVDSSIKDAELAGVGLEGEPRDRFNAIQQELAELSTTFSNHLLDATKAFYLDLCEPEEIEGLPHSLLQMAAQAAREAGHDQATPEQGPWRITLDFPSVSPFLEHSRRRDLREHVYRALITRASEGELDNTPLISRILELRQEQATILDYANYAELSLASKMAPDVSTVEELLEQLRQASFDAAGFECFKP
ncbi:peptidase M3, partial [Candidatus Entotheonella serta]